MQDGLLAAARELQRHLKDLLFKVPVQVLNVSLRVLLIIFLVRMMLGAIAIVIGVSHVHRRLFKRGSALEGRGNDIRGFWGRRCQFILGACLICFPYLTDQIRECLSSLVME